MGYDKELNISTSARTEMVDITSSVAELVDSDIKQGLCVVFVPHTTAGITINENADPAVRSDILEQLNKKIPFEDNYAHLEGNSAAHIKVGLIGSSVTVLIKDGRLLLGTWQSIFFCEFDGPRNRKVWVQCVSN